MHLGSSKFLERFKIYVAHVQEWRAQFQKLESVDLRYEHQVIVKPDSSSSVAKPPVAAGGAAETEAPATPKTVPEAQPKRHKTKQYQ